MYYVSPHPGVSGNVIRSSNKEYLKIYDKTGRSLKASESKIATLLDNVIGIEGTEASNSVDYKTKRGLFSINMAKILNNVEYSPSFGVFDIRNSTLGYQHIYLIKNDESSNEHTDVEYNGAKITMQDYNKVKIDAETFIPKPFRPFFGDNSTAIAKNPGGGSNSSNNGLVNGKSISIRDFLKNYKEFDYTQFTVATPSFQDHLTQMAIYLDMVNKKHETALVLYEKHLKDFESLVGASKAALTFAPSNWDVLSFDKCESDIVRDKEFICSSDKPFKRVSEIKIPYALTMNAAQKIMIEAITDIRENKIGGFLGLSKSNTDFTISNNGIISHSSEINDLAKRSKITSYIFSPKII
ncbi:hypothetical protein AYI70_g9662 [Smittium culicis]|uniref:Uncharacterized protein n=1 Tax=Smittium culicis TaxID=133412 RepID=A0A1R1XA69_9FUNG|nr:hypothetical protein AYI70_g9662 [Smittium culicis]